MKRFEIGKRYTEGGVTFEVISRTAKTVKMALIQHAGRANEKVTSVKSKKINNWETEEVVFWNCYEIHA
ncbi:MAG: hypothetical protein HFH62_11175 [Lachnospiraceae bacterium]|nr:hypothetical protein [Lachnospiraceae bacterium]